MSSQSGLEDDFFFLYRDITSSEYGITPPSIGALAHLA
jgi:hypothetical protein